MTSRFLYAAVASLSFLPVLLCTDPDYPFTIDNVRPFVTIRSLSGDTVPVIGDSIDITITMEGVEFLDSMAMIFGDDSSVWLNETLKNEWYGTITHHYFCDTTGNRSFTYRLYAGGRSIWHDSAEVKVSGIAATITRSPIDTIVDEGTSLLFIAEAFGTDTVRFSWLMNDTLLAGYTGDTLSFESVELHDAGRYRCIADNGWGCADTGEVAVLSVRDVNRAPRLFYDTMPVPVDEGDSVRVSVVADDPDGDSVKTSIPDSNGVAAIGGAAEDTVFFTVKPGWKTGHANREVRVDAVFSDGSLSDTAVLRFMVEDRNRAPHWAVDTLFRSDTSGRGQNIAVPLSEYLVEPDGDPVELLLLEGLPARDTLAADGMTYLLRSIYMAPGEYVVKVAAKDNFGASDTFVIDLSIMENE